MPPPDIPDDLRLAAAALMQTRTQHDGCFLAYLSPSCVRINKGIGLGYGLDAEHLHPQQVLDSWIWRDSWWEPCPEVDFLAQRGRQGANWTEFALWPAGNRAVLVEQWFFQATKNQCGGTGGTRILRHTADGWVESDEPGEAWII